MALGDARSERAGRAAFWKMRLLRDAGLSPQKTRGGPTKRGKARRYTQTVVSAHGGEGSLADLCEIRTNAKMAR